jgi:hypothetical protein
MPDDDDKIIAFPGANRKGPPATAKGKAKDPANVDPEVLSEDQRKAMQLVLSGMSFVMVGIKPTPSGADFFTAVHGNSDELSAAQDHLPGVIERAFSRKGL